MFGFRQILRASRQVTVSSTSAWNEILGSTLSTQHFCAAAPSTTIVPAPTDVEDVHPPLQAAPASAADDEARTVQSSPPPAPDAPAIPPAAQFLELLDVSQEQWEEASGNVVITSHMAQKMSLLDKYKLPTERRQKLVMGTKHSRNLFNRVSPVQLEKRITWLVEEFKFTETDAALVVSKHPSIMNYSVENNISKFMKVLEDYGASKEQLKKMIKSHPQILGYGSKFLTLSKLFNEHLGMQQEELAAIVVKVPRILSYSITNGIEPGLKSMQEYGLSKADIIGIAGKAPNMIGKAFERMVDEKLVWLESSIGLSREQALGVLKLQPLIFYARLEAWVETHEWFLGHGKSQEAFKQMLLDTDYNVLGRRKEGLQRMLDFAVDVLNRDREEALSCPTYFGTNFLLQTLPRVAYLDFKGKDYKEYSLELLCAESAKELFDGLDLKEAQLFKAKFCRVNRDNRVRAIQQRDYPSISSVGMRGTLHSRGGPGLLPLGQQQTRAYAHIVTGIGRMDRMHHIQAMAGASRGPMEVGEVATLQTVKVGFQGKPGAYSELACQRAFPGCSPCPCGTFDDVFKGEVGQALLPMENSTGGTVHDVYRLLPKYGLYIIGEYSLGVDHCLLALPGTDINSIRKVTSHWQALSQCTQYCAQMGFQMEEHDDTAGAAADLVKHQWRGVAAIASSRAAEIYGLKILKQGIQNNQLNYTRFLGFSSSPGDPPQNVSPEECKTTIMFACRDGAGGLQMLLAKLLALDVNLEKIEPQAMVTDPLIDKGTGRAFNYLFTADFAGSVADHKFEDAFALFEEYTGFYRVLGSYQRHVF